MRGKTIWRCAECGIPSPGLCPHPPRIPVAFRPEHAVAWVYLCHMADAGRAGEELDYFCREFDYDNFRRLYPGPTRKQMEQALAWARKWTNHGLREFRETGKPLPPISPEGLYGRASSGHIFSPTEACECDRIGRGCGSST